MPSNLRDYMNKNNITNSSRESREEPRFNHQESSFNRDRGNRDNDHPRKFMNSKGECHDELTRILDELQRKDNELRRTADSHNNNLLKKFNDDYDKYAQQIYRQVQIHLKENKQKLLREIKDRRSVELAETKPIKRNIDQLKDQITSLRDGLQRDSQYRQYISKIVLKDYDSEIRRIQADIDRLRFPNVELRLDDKYYNCFKNDTNRIIVVKDEMMGRFRSENDFSHSKNERSRYQPPYDQPKYQEYNPHPNRDQIKRTNPSRT